jgi:hypothetical protein
MEITCPLCKQPVLVEDRTKPPTLAKHMLEVADVQHTDDVLAIRCPASFAELETATS